MRLGIRRYGLWPAIAGILAVCLLAQPAGAQELPGNGPFVPPPPPPATILVIGDSIAHDLGDALAYAVRNDAGVTVVNRGRAITGLVRDDYFDWPAHLETVLAQIDADIVVVSIGTNDRQAITLGGVIHQRFSDTWRTIYGERASGVMERLTQEGIETFWMGLPSARNRVFANDMAFINEILEESASGFTAVTFVPTWPVTTDGAGNYRHLAVDASGVSRALRSDDGVHFTSFGLRLVIDRLLDAMTANTGRPFIR